MSDKFVTPTLLPTPYERELLTILIEEAAEVQQRATKALRFGIGEVQPGQPLSNADRLSDEIGDFEELVSQCVRAGIVDRDRINSARDKKADKMRRYMQTEPKP